MPVIPSDAGAQVLNAGSPVPISSTGDERAFGNAIAYIGEGLVKVSKDVNDTRNARLADIAADRYKNKLIESYAKQIEEAPLEGDSSGFGASKAVLNGVVSFKDELDSQLENETQRLDFHAKIGNFENEVSMSMFAKEVEKRAKYNEVLTTKSMMEKTQRLRVDPTHTTLVMADIEASILGDKNIPSSKKPEAIRKYQQLALHESTQGLIKNGEFEAAKALAGPLSARIMDIEDRDKFLERIDNAQITAINREWGITTKSDQMLKTHKEDLRQKSIDYFMKAKESAGADSKLNSTLDQEIMRSPDLRGEDKDNLMKVGRVFSAAIDDAFESNVISRAIKGENIRSLVKEVDAASGRTFNTGRSIELLKYLHKLEEDIKRDPSLRERMAGAHQMLSAQGKVNIGEFPMKLRELEIMIGMSKVVFSKKIQANPQGNFEEMARQATQEVFGRAKALKLQRGVAPDKQPTSLQTIDKRMNELNIERQQQGLTPLRKQQILIEFNRLNMNKKILEGEKKHAPGPQPAAPSGTKFVPLKR